MKSLRLCAFLLFAALSPALYGAALAQSGSNVVVVHTPFPRHIFLVTDGKVRFEGASNDKNAEVYTDIQINRLIVAQSSSYDKWAIELAASTVGRRAHIFLRQRIRDAETVNEITIDVLSESPYRISAPSPDAELLNSTQVTVQPTGTMRSDQFEVLLDGKPTGTKLDASGSGTFAPTAMRPGKRKLSVRVNILGDTIDTEPVTIVIPSKIRMRPINQQNLVRIADTSKQAPLSVDIDPDIKLVLVDYYLDDKVIGESKTAPFSGLSIPGDQARSGVHQLTATGHDAAGNSYLTPAMQITITDGAMLELSAWEDKLLIQLDEVIVSQRDFVDFISRLGPQPVLYDSVKASRAAKLAINTELERLKNPTKMRIDDFSSYDLLPVDQTREGAAIGDAVRMIKSGLGHLARGTSKMQDGLYSADKMIKEGGVINLRKYGPEAFGNKILITDRPDPVPFWNEDASYLCTEIQLAFRDFTDAEAALRQIDSRNNVRRTDHEYPFGSIHGHKLIDK